VPDQTVPDQTVPDQTVPDQTVEVSVDIGFAIPISGSWATPENQLRIVRRAEELGYAQLWTFQRLLVPLDEAGAPTWAPQYRSVHDPLVTLGWLAGLTTGIRLGVAVVNMPFYSPLLLAKMLTTIDTLSGGRLDAGLGIGWAPEEYAATGAPYHQRGRRADDFLRCLEAVWTTDPVEYAGEFYQVPRSRVAPRPVQRPHPPVLLGGTAEPALRRAGRLADGWISSSQADLTKIAHSIEVVRAGAREAGRDPDRLRFVCRGAVQVRPAGAADRKPLTGSLAEIRGDFDGLRADGITQTFVDVNFDPEIGSPDADPDVSMRRAEEALEALAPG
jgi:probable F420-dependent oxidoreductase